MTRTRFSIVLRQLDSHAHFQLRADNQPCHSNPGSEICMKLAQFVDLVAKLDWPFGCPGELAEDWVAIHPYGIGREQAETWLAKNQIDIAIRGKDGEEVPINGDAED